MWLSTAREAGPKAGRRCVSGLAPVSSPARARRLWAPPSRRGAERASRSFLHPLFSSSAALVISARWAGCPFPSIRPVVSLESEGPFPYFRTEPSERSDAGWRHDVSASAGHHRRLDMAAVTPTRRHPRRCLSRPQGSDPGAPKSAPDSDLRGQARASRQARADHAAQDDRGAVFPKPVTRMSGYSQSSEP